MKGSLTLIWIRASILLSGLLAVAVTGCGPVSITTSRKDVFDIRGVGVGSTCQFSARYEGIFPCDLWEGVGSSFGPISSVTADIDSEGYSVIAIASSRDIGSIEGSNIVASSIDGTLALISHDAPGEFHIKVVATDGADVECEVDTSVIQDGEFDFVFCDQDW